MEKKSSISIRQITYAGVFIAIGVIINSVRVGSISFGGFPIILSGYALGPVMGFIVGGLTDIVAFIVRPSAGGGFNPAFILTSALTGAIPVLVTTLLGDRYPNFKLRNIFIGILIGQTITSVIMVPVFLSHFFGKQTLGVYMLKALKKQIPSIPLYAILAKPVLEGVTRVINFRRI